MLESHSQNISSIKSSINCKPVAIGGATGQKGGIDSTRGTYQIHCTYMLIVDFPDMCLTCVWHVCRVLVMRGWRACKQACCKAGAVKESDAGRDPLEEMYCKTLKFRMSSDAMVASVIFVLISLLSLSTGFCRSTVRCTHSLSYSRMFGRRRDKLITHVMF